MTKHQRKGLDHQLATIIEKLGDTAILGDREGARAHNERERGRLGASARNSGSGYERQSSVAQSSGLNEVKWIDDLTFLANLEER